VIERGKNTPTPVAEVVFNITDHPAIIAMIENLKGKSGWLYLQRLIIDSFETEEYLLFSGFDDMGRALDQETCEKLFNCQATVGRPQAPLSEIQEHLKKETQRHRQATISRSLEENNRHFNEAREKLDKWAEDMEIAAGKELDDTKNQIRALNRQARLSPTIEEQHEIQEKIRKLEKKKRRLRQKIFDIEDEIEEKRDQLIDALEKRMHQKTKFTPLFSLRWSVV